MTNGNPNSVSDAGVAAEVALAGIRGACMNVMINLSGLEDSPYVNDTQNKIFRNFFTNFLYYPVYF